MASPLESVTVTWSLDFLVKNLESGIWSCSFQDAGQGPHSLMAHMGLADYMGAVLWKLIHHCFFGNFTSAKEADHIDAALTDAMRKWYERRGLRV